MDDKAIEQEIQAKGLTAPRITPGDIEANIASEHYFTAADGALYHYSVNVPEINYLEGLPSELYRLTFCVLVLRNGFTVTGESACASPENFDAEIGRKIARQNAVAKVWPLMGYELKQRLHDDAQKASLPLDVLPVQGDGVRHRVTKDVRAWPMNRADYNAYRGWTLPADENGADEGYLVEYLDGGKSNHPHHHGYISWSPADVFHRAYNPIA